MLHPASPLFTAYAAGLGSGVLGGWLFTRLTLASRLWPRRDEHPEPEHERED
jgi:hypothetical protein